MTLIRRRRGVHNGRNLALFLAPLAVQFKSDIKEKSGIVLYEASHEFLDSEGFDNCIIFGVYETEEEALAVKTEKVKIPPYCETPEGFMISECKVDLIGWTEGFVPWT